MILLLLTDSNRGQPQGDRPSQTVVTSVGDDVILPCHLEPAADVVSESVEWGRPDLEPRFVHVWHEGQNFLDNQNPSYRGRTSVSVDKLKHGDLSLTLSAVKHSDNGKYRCYFPAQNKESTIELVVGSVSSPVISGININGKGLVLQCESEGWYPEPEVLWLDGEGNHLSAGHTKTVRGPDGLYTVSSRLTVEERHSSSFTCRVQQKDIKQTRETHLQISSDHFEVPSSAAARVSIIVVISLSFIFAAIFVLWKWRRNQIKDIIRRERELLRAEGQKMEEKKERLEEDLQKKEEEHRDLEQVVNMLTEQSKELQNQTEAIKHQNENMEKNKDDIEKNIQSAEKKAESDKAQGYLEMKQITLKAKKQLTERKQEDDELLLKTQELQHNTKKLLHTMTDRKRAVESTKQKINEQLEEVQRKL
uniref:butyrophilin subfamily 3 member A2-like n=1 Tax=Semicossyphus pulcher TaxID=241346 RepID=UPI0037E72B0F